MNNTGEQIVAARRAKNMTQTELARALDVSRSTVAHWETGRSVPGLDMLMRLSQALEYDFLSAAAQGIATDGEPAAPQASPVEPAPASEEPAPAPAEPAPVPEEPETALVEPAPALADPAPPRPASPRRRYALLAGAVLAILLACALALTLRRPAEPAPEAVPAVGDAVDAATVTRAYFQQSNPNREGKAYFAVDCLLQTTKSQDIDVWMYTLNLHEKHGVAFSIDRFETYTFVGDAVDERSFDAEYLAAAAVKTEIDAYGDWFITGGLPVDEKVRGMGFAIRGTDATGEALSFVFYQPLAS